MRDAIGQVFALQIILAFVLLINGYMAYSVNYTRAFRVKNQIVTFIEQYEGPYNEEAIEKINDYIDQMAYDVNNQQMLNFQNNNSGAECPGYKGWCYVEHNVSVASGDGERNGKYYTIVTFVNIDIPVVNEILGLGNFLQVSGETRTIYD